jgi:hypothetical protein
MNHSQFITKFKHCQTFLRVCKARRHYDEGRRGSHFEVGRAMPLARADIFSCSDRWLVNRLLSSAFLTAKAGGLVARKTRADEAKVARSLARACVRLTGPLGLLAAPVQYESGSRAGPHFSSSVELCSLSRTEQKTREYFKNSFFSINFAPATAVLSDEEWI